MNEEICPFCGKLHWTIEMHGKLTHKCACPFRKEDYCQSHPQGCKAIWENGVYAGERD